MNKFKILIASVLIPCIIILLVQSMKSDEADIDRYITGKGGTIISIDNRYINIGPFWVKGKGQSIYKIEYMDKDTRTVREAWMRTGVFNDDWVWDYKEN